MSVSSVPMCTMCSLSHNANDALLVKLMPPPYLPYPSTHTPTPLCYYVSLHIKHIPVKASVSKCYCLIVVFSDRNILPSCTLKNIKEKTLEKTYVKLQI